jgi:hypothetical protein
MHGSRSVMGFFTANVYHLWAIIVGMATIVFGAGAVVERTRTARFVTKEVHAANLETVHVKLDAIKIQITDVKTSLDKVNKWIDDVRAI